MGIQSSTGHLKACQTGCIWFLPFLGWVVAVVGVLNGMMMVDLMVWQAACEKQFERIVLAIT